MKGVVGIGHRASDYVLLGERLPIGLMLLHVSVPKSRHHSFRFSFGLMLLHVSVPKFRHHSLLCMAGVSIPESRNGTAYPRRLLAAMWVPTTEG